MDPRAASEKGPLYYPASQRRNHSPNLILFPVPRPRSSEVRRLYSEHTRSQPVRSAPCHAQDHCPSLLIHRQPADRAVDRSAAVPQTPEHHLGEDRRSSPDVVAVDPVLNDLDRPGGTAAEDFC